jgi:hypothetical protein
MRVEGGEEGGARGAWSVGEDVGGGDPVDALFEPLLHGGLPYRTYYEVLQGGQGLGRQGKRVRGCGAAIGAEHTA